MIGVEMREEDLVDLAERNCQLPQSLRSAPPDVKHKALSARLDKRRGSCALVARFGTASTEQGDRESLRYRGYRRKTSQEQSNRD